MTPVAEQVDTVVLDEHRRLRIAPVNYAFSHGDLFIHSGAGPKLQAAETLSPSKSMTSIRARAVGGAPSSAGCTSYRPTGGPPARSPSPGRPVLAIT